MFKNSLWAFWSAISVTALSLTSVSVGQKIEYGSRMQKYEKWREQFFKEKLGGDDMCEKIEECIEQKNKEYLPKPNEDKLWKKAHESLKVNNQGQSGSQQLTYIKDSYQLKDYCYEEVKKAISEANGKNQNKQYFNVRGNIGKQSHERCVLDKEDLEKLIEVKK